MNTEKSEKCINVAPSGIRRMKKIHQMEIAQLFEYRRNCLGEKRTAVENVINAKVVAWNLAVVRRRHYFDLHGMTPQGAVDFVAQIVEGRRPGYIKLETGRGNHSKDNIPAIQNRLLQDFGNLSGFQIAIDPSNLGVLILSFQ
ncbi:Smr domain-containing protein [Caenorhabditis elegans]|uniref:Smr domain-containing protein n=1 Tax=Caenorhabditis elegans TaxID=6239 RepID=Q9N495_CAEEL|nr:Smr domain-containing protein [Caenorhabditis elegans]CCD72970.1 Smr domain-containing protein [Caenorhabditis elegans]|eukprot:NP_494390.1 Uncharacterized protein CELE_Y110A2AL.1 [Caenorhabditis elegans]